MEEGEEAEEDEEVGEEGHLRWLRGTVLIDGSC